MYSKTVQVYREDRLTGHQGLLFSEETNSRAHTGIAIVGHVIGFSNRTSRDIRPGWAELAFHPILCEITRMK